MSNLQKKIRTVKIIKFLSSITVAVVLGFSIVSCENENIDTMHASELEASTNDLNASQSNDGLVQTRARSINYYITPTVGNYTPNSSSSIPLSGTYNGNYYYFGGGVIRAQVTAHSADEVTILITKQDGGIFNNSGTAYVKLGGVTGTSLAAVSYPSGVSEVEVTVNYDLSNYGIAHLYPTITSDNHRFYAEPIMLYTLPFFNKYNGYWESKLLGTVNNIKVRCNGSNNLNPYGGINQCTEFCHRYYNNTYGISFSYGNACDWFGNITELVSYSNGNIKPRPGDVLCMAGGNEHSSGHVAIIIEVGDTYIKIAQQNTGKSSNGPWSPIGGELSFNKNSNIISPPDSHYTIQGVLRKPV